MVIAIFPSLEGENLEDFGIRLAEQWRIGQKGLDNGVILLVFVQERRVRAEIGYGLEPVLTDAVAGQIIRDAIAPRFRDQRYAEGLEAAVDAVYARIETRGAPAASRRDPGVSPWTLGVLAIFGIIAIILVRDAMSTSSRARRSGYTAGGHRRGWGAPTVIVPPMWGGRGGRGGGGGGWGGGGFSAGGGSFGGGGASGSW